MEKEVLVEVKNVSKKFSKDLKTSLRYGLQDSLIAILPFQKSNNNTLRKSEFWAVRDVSFKLRRGECIGLIGHNGAGKSTLLKMINGLINPDGGSIQLKGKISALIELGAGFNPILTGRENIYNNAAVLGFSKKEIDAKMDDIIDFSEIVDFIDSPLQNYSSGMKVRLGFAVAAHLEPDVLIVDEVLAVGDLSFRLKCFKKIDEILPNTAVVFVSHNMSQISRICSDVILLEKGQIIYHGRDTSKGVELYYGKTNADQAIEVFNTKQVKLDSFEFLNLKNTNNFTWNDNLEIELKLSILDKSIKKIPFININIFDKEDRNVAVIKGIEEQLEVKDQQVVFRISIANLQLSKGVYYFNLAVSGELNSDPMLRLNYLKILNVVADREIWPSFYLNSNWQIKN